MDRFARALLLAIALAAPGDGSAQVRSSEERRVEGRVLEVKIAICQMRPRGCAGSLILDAGRGARPQRLTVRVQLGVPIRYGDKYVMLGGLVGTTVKVVYVNEKDSIVARWIEVLEGSARQ
jgi:hypothetical protein